MINCSISCTIAFESEVINLLKNNLHMLLAERQLTISQIASITGISRTTLTSLDKNRSKMVQMETVNKLCQILHISPAEFFAFVPIDFDYHFDIGELTTPDKIESPLYKSYPFRFDVTQRYISNLTITVSENNQYIDTINLTGYTNKYYRDQKIVHITIALRASDDNHLEKLQTYLRKMPFTFGAEVKNDIADVVRTTLLNTLTKTTPPHYNFLRRSFISTEIDYSETNEHYLSKQKKGEDNIPPFELS